MIFSHTPVIVSSLINCEAFWERRLTSVFTRKPELRKIVLFKVMGKNIRDNKLTKSCWKKPLFSPSPLFGKMVYRVERVVSGVSKRLAKALPCASLTRRRRAISALSSSILFIGASAILFEEVFNKHID